jgi:hypothetical protein
MVLGMLLTPVLPRGSIAGEPLDDGALAAYLHTLRSALDGAPQPDRDFFHDFQSRGDYFFHDGHDQRVTFPTDLRCAIHEAVDAATADLDALTSERRIHHGGPSLHACADPDDAGASKPRADEHALGGERNADALRFAYVQSLG